MNSNYANTNQTFETKKAKVYKQSNKWEWGDFLPCIGNINTRKQVLGLITFLRNIEQLQMMYLNTEVFNIMIAGTF